MAADGGGGGIPGEGKLRSYVERIERLNEDLKAVKIDLGEVFSEAAGDGFDKSILRIVIKRRSQDPAKRMLQESLVDLYDHSDETIEALAAMPWPPALADA